MTTILPTKKILLTYISCLTHFIVVISMRDKDRNSTWKHIKLVVFLLKTTQIYLIQTSVTRKNSPVELKFSMIVSNYNNLHNNHIKYIHTIYSDMIYMHLWNSSNEMNIIANLKH